MHTVVVKIKTRYLSQLLVVYLNYSQHTVKLSLSF